MGILDDIREEIDQVTEKLDVLRKHMDLCIKLRAVCPLLARPDVQCNPYTDMISIHLPQDVDSIDPVELTTPLRKHFGCTFERVWVDEGGFFSLDTVIGSVSLWFIFHSPTKQCKVIPYEKTITKTYYKITCEGEDE